MLSAARIVFFPGTLLGRATPFDEVFIAVLISVGMNASQARKMLKALLGNTKPAIARSATVMVIVATPTKALARTFGQKKDTG